METHASFRNIPDNATLRHFGNCFRYNNGPWNIACQFELADKTLTQINLAIECLPVLSIGRQYSKGKIIRPRGSVAELDLPLSSSWKLVKFSDYEQFTSRRTFNKEFENQYLYRFKLNDYYLWIPCIELARVLFLKTAVAARLSFYEPNLHRIVDVETADRSAKIRLAESYPQKLLDIKSHQSYLAWLVLNPDVLKSFLSIYKRKFETSYHSEKLSRWAFQFEPFEMENIFVRCYTQTHGKNILIEEISSVANLSMGDGFEFITFDHPLDVKHELENGEGKNGERDKKRRSDTFDPEVSDKEAPSNVTRARLLNVPKGALYFNEILNTERVFKIQIVETGDKKEGGEKEEGRKRTLSIREGKGHGKHKSADFRSDENSQSDTRFFDYIRKALDELPKIAHLNIVSVHESIGTIPVASAKKFLYIKPSVHRAFLYAEIEICGGDSLHLIEIDLSDNHSLTTLVFRLRSNDSVDETLHEILSELVNNHGRWDRQLVQRLTLMQSYIPHPKVLGPDKPGMTFKNWATRIANEF